MYAFAFLEFIHGRMEHEAHLKTGASLCEQIHRVYRYLYARELAFHNRFSGDCVACQRRKRRTRANARADRFRTPLSVPRPGVMYIFFVSARKNRQQSAAFARLLRAPRSRACGRTDICVRTTQACAGFLFLFLHRERERERSQYYFCVCVNS